MRRAGTSAYALTLVPPRPQRTTEVVEIFGVEHIVRRGIYFALIGKRRRSVYQNFDGKVLLGDECKCATDWQPDFEVKRSEVCPIDAHRMEAFDQTAEE